MGWALFAVLLSFQLSGALLSMLPSVFPALKGSALFIMGVSFFCFLCIALPVGLRMLRTLPDAPPPVTPKPITASLFLKLLLITFCVTFLAALLTAPLSALLSGVGIRAENPNTLIADASFLPTVLFGVVLSPLAEEFFFRFLLINKIRGLGSRFSILASAVIFSLFHASLFQLLTAFAGGFVFAYAYLLTDDLFCCAALHTCVNAYSVVLYPLCQKLGKTALSIYGDAALLVIIFGLWYLSQHRKLLTLGPKEDRQIARIRRRFLFLSPGMILYLLGVSALILFSSLNLF